MLTVVSVFNSVFVTMRTMRSSCESVVFRVLRNRENPQVLRIPARSITAKMVNRQVERYLADVEFVHRSMSKNHLLLAAHPTGVSKTITAGL